MIFHGKKYYGLWWSILAKEEQQSLKPSLKGQYQLRIGRSVSSALQILQLDRRTRMSRFNNKARQDFIFLHNREQCRKKVKLSDTQQRLRSKVRNSNGLIQISQSYPHNYWKYEYIYICPSDNNSQKIQKYLERQEYCKYIQDRT